MNLSILKIKGMRGPHRIALVGILCLVVVGIFFLVLKVAQGIVETTDRTKATRVYAETRSLGTAIDAYFVDHGEYPAMKTFEDFAGNQEQIMGVDRSGLYTIHPGDPSNGLEGITTPVAYLTSLPFDAFTPKVELPFGYYTDGDGWIVFSAGPDGDYDLMNPDEIYDSSVSQPTEELLSGYTYEPTNGTYSDGDIWRVKQ